MRDVCANGQDAPTRQFTVLAQDPAVTRKNGSALTTQVTVPAERLEIGPKGYRIHVIDYDASTNHYYKPRRGKLAVDPYKNVTDLDRLLNDPHFHQQNVYAISMATLSTFEAALGRHVSWGFDDAARAHHLKIAPHAFADPNAYYSRHSESLCFGYFTGEHDNKIFTCLSHDIVVHETAHALLDGLRNYYLYPSHVDQAAFHEAFSDIVALLSVLKNNEILEHSLSSSSDKEDLIASNQLTRQKLAENGLIKLAEEFGRELSFVRGDSLRHSVTLPPSKYYLNSEQFKEPHHRGEVLVASVIGSFLSVWERRLDPLGRDRGIALSRKVVAEEGATAAKQLLTIVIRGIDYLPPIDITFSDYLSALLTADQELYPDDSRYSYRQVFRTMFESYGISPASDFEKCGTWDPPPGADSLRYDGIHLTALQRDPNAVYRFVWGNQSALAVDSEAFTRVVSLRPVTRVSNDGIILHETIAEYVQTILAMAYELEGMGIEVPDGLSRQTPVRLYGGGTLIFNEFGKVKYHIGTGVKSQRQSKRLQNLFKRGAFNRDEQRFSSFAQMHQRRMTARVPSTGEQW